jgi:hypothetical protein
MRSDKGIGSCAASLTRRMAALQERSAANWRGEGDAQRRLARRAGSEGECVARLKTLVLVTFPARRFLAVRSGSDI